MLTLCWSAKGGSGTTFVAVALAVTGRGPTLLVDFAGDAAMALGLPDADLPDLSDWIASDAPADRLHHLERPVTTTVDLLPTRSPVASGGRLRRGDELTRHLRAIARDRDVVVDAGCGAPPAVLAAVADRSLLVTRPCYLATQRAARLPIRPTGIVLVDEPGRSLGPDDIVAAIGAPIVATLQLDPKIARAVDAGLLVSRLPSGCARALRAAS